MRAGREAGEKAHFWSVVRVAMKSYAGAIAGLRWAGRASNDGFSGSSAATAALRVTCRGQSRNASRPG